MALKPRKQCKHYPYLFLLNEKTFLRYLRGQYLKFDVCTYDDNEVYYSVNYYKLSKTKEKIFEGGSLFERIDSLVNKLTDDNKLDYAPIYCSTWIVTGDNESISLMHQTENAYLKKSKKHKSSKDKREERKALRNTFYIMGFESTAHTPHLPLSNRDYKWWKKGHSDGEVDYELERNFDRYCDLLKFTEKDYDKAEIEIIPYILNGICYESIESTENIFLSRENFQSFFFLLDNNQDALSVIIESGELQSISARLDGTPYLSSLITFQEFTETIQPLLNPNQTKIINHWRGLGCQFINIDFLQKSLKK
jgi:hypothetical protein